MENIESNPKPQQTGGLKLMTVFVVVLALHVIVIGGMTTYYLLKGSSADSELLTDKLHKTVKPSMDGSLPTDSTTPDASATASTTPPDASTASLTPSPDQAAPNDSNSSTTTIAPTTPTTAAANPTASTGIPLHTAATLSSAPDAITASVPPVTEPTTPAVADKTALAAPAPAISTPAPEPALATAPAPVSDGAPYVVKPKDSLARIAHMNHTTVAKLKAANNLNSDLLRIGQKLVIPARSIGAPTAVATTATADSAPAPATAPSTVASAPAVQPAPAPVAEAGNHTYTVVKGDTLTKIAHKFRTTPTAIMTANSITDPAKLSIGKKLRIPSREARSANNAAPAVTAPAQAKAGSAAQLANVEQQ